MTLLAESQTQILEEEIITQQNVQGVLNNDPSYLRTMAMISETEQSTQNTLNTIDETLKKLSATLEGVQKTVNIFGRHKVEFKKATAHIEKRTGSLATPVLPKEGDMSSMPVISSIKDIVQQIKTKYHTAVLTGKNGKVSESTSLTYEDFCKSPEEIWRWHHEFRKLVEKNKPSISHHALADLQLLFKKQNQKFTLITQNIDGYHVAAYLQALEKIQAPQQNSPIKSTAKPNHTRTSSVRPSTNLGFTSSKIVTTNSTTKSSLQTSTSSTLKKVIKEEVKQKPVVSFKKFGLCDGVYEINGNINYMRCGKSCTPELFPGPKVGFADDFVPECSKCKGAARPHTLFFDEDYEEQYYRKVTILNGIQEADCLIVIGAALDTEFTASIVSQAIAKKQLIIEIDPKPSIKYGNVKHLIGDAEEVLPELAKALQAKDSKK